MKIIIEPGDGEETEVVIRGRSGSEEVRQILELLDGMGGISQIPLYAEEKEYFFKPEEISCFLTKDGKVYAYLQSGVYEAKGRLYELARQLRHRGFIQISKSTVVNAAMVAFVEVEFSGNYTAFLKDKKTKLLISRNYMKDFRKYIMEGR